MNSLSVSSSSPSPVAVRIASASCAVPLGSCSAFSTWAKVLSPAVPPPPALTLAPLCQLATAGARLVAWLLAFMKKVRSGLVPPRLSGPIRTISALTFRTSFSIASKQLTYLTACDLSLGFEPPCQQRYRWHLEKNATQMPAISWRLTTPAEPTSEYRPW